MTTIKNIAACARHTCAKGRFSVNPYTVIGKLKSAVLKFLPVLENTMESAGNLPDSEVFSRPEFAGMGFPMALGFGRDGLVRKAGRMADSMFSTSRPPVALEKAACGFPSQSGAEAMIPVNSTSTSAPDAFARQHAIEHALSAALFHLRQPYTPAALYAATGRASRALSLLKQACAEAKKGGAA